MGLSGVASIQETRRIHEQILSVEDNYRHIENMVEGIRSDTSRVAVMQRDRLLDRSASAEEYARQLAGLRDKTEATVGQLRSSQLQQDSRAFEWLETALRAYMDAVAAEFRVTPAISARPEFDARFRSQSQTIFSVAEELGKLNEENFESRRRALNQSVENLQYDIWETIITALVVGAVIAGASIL